MYVITYTHAIIVVKPNDRPSLKYLKATPPRCEITTCFDIQFPKNDLCVDDLISKKVTTLNILIAFVLCNVTNDEIMLLHHSEDIKRNKIYPKCFGRPVNVIHQMFAV